MEGGHRAGIVAVGVALCRIVEDIQQVPLKQDKIEKQRYCGI